MRSASWDFRLRSLGLSRCSKSSANIGFGHETITITTIIIIMQKNWCNDRVLVSAESSCLGLLIQDTTERCSIVVLDHSAPPLDLLKRASQAGQGMCKCCEGKETKQNNRQRKYSHTSLTPEFAEASVKGQEGRSGRDLGLQKTKPVGGKQTAGSDGGGGGDGGVPGLGDFNLGGRVLAYQIM